MRIGFKTSHSLRCMLGLCAIGPVRAVSQAFPWGCCSDESVPSEDQPSRLKRSFREPSALQHFNGIQRKGETRLKPRNISKTKTTV
ncbi:hypothetical protein CABS01_16317 [Colletotrichum abscissum]|uniref:uncharacterized protein n=1 Tax=Colletotrichum abscissum TaxID=1671311 RepID=UPI0027D47FE6|nr:uncharacterized protein CABS01_16317 [Colletotrichum abscissum]KAK1471672.1 hypothetical protein CABS01_16317 [Colletotrichum abscissum]